MMTKQMRHKVNQRRARHQEIQGQVMGLALQGYTTAAIATTLQLNLQQVGECLHELECAARELTSAADTNLTLGLKLQRVRRVQHECMATAQGETGLAKNALLNTVLRCEEIETRLLQDAQVLPKAADRVESTHWVNEEGVDLRRVGPAELAAAIIGEQRAVERLVGGAGTTPVGS
jgi:hypothetical protein